MTKECSERITICEHWGSCYKKDECANRSTEKWFQVVLPKASQMLPKAHHCPRKLLWRKPCVSSKVICFCVIHQFWEVLLEATGIIICSYTQYAFKKYTIHFKPQVQSLTCDNTLGAQDANFYSHFSLGKEPRISTSLGEGVSKTV
jgi:hypothetical protein